MDPKQAKTLAALNEARRERDVAIDHVHKLEAELAEARRHRDRLIEFLDHTLTHFGVRMSEQWRAHARAAIRE